MNGGYPLLLDVAGRRAVVVGGGPVAARRARGLVEAGGEVVLVAPWVCEDVRDLVDAGRLEWVARDYTGDDLDGAWLVQQVNVLEAPSGGFSDAVGSGSGTTATTAPAGD